MAGFDAHGNFGISYVSVPPSPAASGTSLKLRPGDIATFPSPPPFNIAVWPLNTVATRHCTAEVIRVTAVSGDTLTVLRKQEGECCSDSIVAGDQGRCCHHRQDRLSDIEEAIIG